MFFKGMEDICPISSKVYRPDRFVLFIVSLIYCLYNPVTAESVDSTGVGDLEYLNYLLDMKITSGSFLELNPVQSPVSMTMISKDDIKISGARNISELLEIYVPGFQYMFNKWNGTLWAMRGVTNDRNTKIIFLIDGHKMNTQARDGFQGETVLGLMDDIERVEVLRGPAGLVYGSGAIAGVVNVVTTKKQNDVSSVSTAFGTMGSQEIQGSIHTTPADGQTFSFSAGFRRADGLAQNQSRIYGFGSWPFPGNGLVKTGVPSDGRYGSTDGDWRCSAGWQVKKLDLYFRATHQKENAGGWFIQDPWPEKVGYPDSTYRPAVVDKKTVTWDDPFWSITESWRASRFQFISDNILFTGNYRLPIGLNELQLNASYDRNTNRTCLETRPGYELDVPVRGFDFADGTFGETRITGDAIFNINSVPHLQLATGLEYRLDIIGKDMTGKNIYSDRPARLEVSNVNYNTFALFTEGFYELNNRFDLHLGGRLDFHTRAIMANPKIAFIYKPTEKHAIKLIGQSSSNNGSADNYEYNRFHFRDDGTVSLQPTFSNDLVIPSRSSGLIQPAPPLDSLHKLRPEKVYSLELAYTGMINDELTLTPSAAIGNVKDLFGWSQTLFRVVNAGSYRYFNLDMDANYKRKWLNTGINHTFQRPILTDADHERHSNKIHTLPQSGPFYDSVITNGIIKYIPIPDDSMSDFGVNLVKDGITADGRNFLNLNTNVTKLYLTISPFEWMALHVNAQIFWGLPGRASIIAKDTGFNYWNISDSPEQLGWYNYFKKSVSKKVNMGIHFYLPKDIDIGMYVYDLLGIDNPFDSKSRRLTINTIRWQQMYSADQKDLYSTDQRTFEIRLSKSF